MKILKTTDRVKLSIPDSTVSVTIAPLTSGQKIEIASKMKMEKGESVPDYNQQGMLLVKYAVKNIHGVTDYEGKEYSLDFSDENNLELTDSCVEDITSVLSDSDLILPVTLAANKVLSKIKDVKVEVNPKN